MSEDGDAVLVQRCRDGDRTAFEQLVLRYQTPVYNSALRMLRDPEEARDVAQTAFLRAYEHLADYDPSYKFYSWMYRIAVNETLNALARRRPTEEFGGDEADGAPGPDREVEGLEARVAIEAAVMTLTPELRAVIVLRHFMDLRYQDMSEILGLPEKTVKSRLYSARQLLRSRLLAAGVL
jgi:RNA polymerase sigma-70 factor (ECF subfamily)